MHVSVPQCDVFGYFSIESEIVILIIPVDHYPKALQVGLSIHWKLSSLMDVAWGSFRGWVRSEAFGRIGKVQEVAECRPRGRERLSSSDSEK